DFDGQQKHHEIEGEAVVLHVIEVVLELLLRVLFRSAVAVAHLRPAGDPRLDEMALRIERDGASERLDEYRPLGPRTDEAHLAEEHVQELRQLVDAQPPDDAADEGRSEEHTSELQSPYDLVCRLLLEKKKKKKTKEREAK